MKSPSTEQGSGQTMRVEQLMRRPVVSCRPEDTLHAAAQQMWEHDCGVLPVADAEGRVVGVVTDRDICMAAWSRGQTLADIPVSSAMSRTVFSCRPGDSMDIAERVMSEKQVRRLPVVDANSRLVGMLSLNDITRFVASTSRGDGAKEVALQTLAAISRPRPPAVQAATA